MSALKKNPHPLPSQFFSSKTLFTLSGSAAAVWLICLTLSSVIPPGVLTVYHWRLIALLCSEFIAIMIIIKNKDFAFEPWVIGIINGLLIFVNASGINAISTGLAFTDKNVEKLTILNTNGSPKLIYTSIFPFIREVNWWPDLTLVRERNALNEKNLSLTNKSRQDSLSYEELKKQCLSSNKISDATLLTQIQNLQSEIAQLKGNPAAPDTSYVSTINQLRESLQQIKDSLRNCQSRLSQTPAKQPNNPPTDQPNKKLRKYNVPNVPVKVN